MIDNAHYDEQDFASPPLFKMPAIICAHRTMRALILAERKIDGHGSA